LRISGQIKESSETLLYCALTIKRYLFSVPRHADSYLENSLLKLLSVILIFQRAAVGIDRAVLVAAVAEDPVKDRATTGLTIVTDGQST
jgi:hypothetical protein